MSPPSFDIPKECKAGVVVDEGPNFRVEVKMVPVPEIGIAPLTLLPVELKGFIATPHPFPKSRQNSSWSSVQEWSTKLLYP
jgi:hypothetical protein